LQHKSSHLYPPGKAAFALLLIGLVLLLNAMASAPALHELIHHDASQADHQCAVTLFAHGKVDSAGPAVPVIVPTVTSATAPHVVLSIYSATIENLPPGRAPPAIVSPLV